jgi:hypothetical protein
MKFVTFLRAPEGQPREAFQDWCAREHLPAVKDRAPSFRGGVARRKTPPPPMPKAEGGEAPFDVDPGLSYDMLLELWLPSSEDFRREVLPCEQPLRERGCRFASYAILPRLQKDPRVAEAGAAGRRPELTYVLAMRWLPNVTREFASQEWADHSAIALRCQPRMSRYEQNLVIETISWTRDVSLIDAYADFSFPTVDDFVSGFVVTEEELQDMSGLVGSFDAAFLSDAEPF